MNGYSVFPSKMSKYFLHTRIGLVTAINNNSVVCAYTRVYVSSESFARASRKDISRERDTNKPEQAAISITVV